MRQSTREAPGHDIARPIGFRVARDRQDLSVTGEEHRKIQHPPVINVPIGTGQTPIARIGREGFAHVLVDEKLEIDAHAPVGADDHIGADAANHRHVTSGKGDDGVAGVVIEGDADLLMSAFDDAAQVRRQLLRQVLRQLLRQAGRRPHQQQTEENANHRRGAPRRKPAPRRGAIQQNQGSLERSARRRGQLARTAARASTARRSGSRQWRIAWVVHGETPPDVPRRAAFGTAMPSSGLRLSDS